MLGTDLLSSTCIKIGMLMLTGISSHLSLSPPNAPPPSKECLRQKTLFERGVRWVTFCSKAMVWMSVSSDAYTTLNSYNVRHGSSSVAAGTYSTPASLHLSSTNASSSHDYQVPTITPPHPHLPIAPLSLLFTVGVLCAILGACLRRWCFRTLGHFFTFELTIRASHSLITTGPYAFVRHPSYTGIYLTLLGASAVAFAPGSFLRDSWFAPLLTRCSLREAAVSFGGSSAWCMPLLPATFSQAMVSLLVAFWFAKVCYALRSTHGRLEVEDAELHKTFGETWETYAERVPWKLLPGVF